MSAFGSHRVDGSHRWSLGSKYPSPDADLRRADGRFATRLPWLSLIYWCGRCDPGSPRATEPFAPWTVTPWPPCCSAPGAGRVADRVDLRKLLVVTQTLYCLLAALLWALAVAGAASVVALVAIGVAGGVVQIADSPARQALVSRLVPPDDLASAVRLNGVVVNSARVV